VALPEGVPLGDAVELGVLEGEEEGEAVMLGVCEGVMGELGEIDGLAPNEREEVGLGL
jgi:hypothetical protein